jgi:hypothetical protein
MSDDLQSRFAEALRRELGMADGAAAPGAPMVNVQPAQVSVSPRVVAEMPALPQPLEVLDVQRFSGAFEWQLSVTRGPDGLLTAARMTPVALVHFGDAYD